MVSYIEKQNLLYSSQYGFRKGHSTQHAILELLNDIQTNMNKKLFSCGVFIDLKKAFDTVDHNILLNKLNHYGFCGIVNDWVSSYLKNRTQTTQVGQHISNKVEVSCGVPQGSVIGPLLCVNDMHKCSDKLKFYLFADDTNILYADKNMKALIAAEGSTLFLT
jgi:retron-type reverse transcriptase